MAADPETGEVEAKRVVQTFENESDELVHVTAGGERIMATPEHPFYVPQRGWVGAIELRAGDILVQVNGEYAVVEQIEHELLETPVTVYNFEVEGFHTYFVGDSGVLVHNDCDLPKNNSRMSTDDALDLSEDFLGDGYREVGSGSGRYVSADNTRQVRMGLSDITGAHAGGPHINFDKLLPKYKSTHVFLID